MVVPEGEQAHAADLLAGRDGLRMVPGGATRQDSVLAGLAALEGSEVDQVLIHDAARPDCPGDVVDRLVAALAKYPGAIPTLTIVDSIARADGDLMGNREERDQLRRVQTPQAFRFNEILAAHRKWDGERNAGDDAQVAHRAGLAVTMITGDERLNKLTFAKDFSDRTSIIRTGTGFDVHRLSSGEQLWLCGVHVEHDMGLAGHSDADVALHAVVDAILGAIGEGDIGQHFPPSDPQWRGVASARFIEHAVSLARAKGYAIGNVDLTIICEAPKIGPYRDEMRARLAGLLGVQDDLVNVKATTTERLGFTGRGEGISAQAVATLFALS